MRPDLADPGPRARIPASWFPIAAAIGIFGVIFGVLARPTFGAGPTLISSVIVYSGALQFSLAALASSGASLGAIVATSVALNLRHVLLGAVIRPRLEESGRARRALWSWFLLDESFGLALDSKAPGATLLKAGLLFYAAWLAGTALGVAGASVESLAGVAEAAFPVLFIGLASISSPSWPARARALLAAAVVAGIAIVWPEGRDLAPVGAALVVALAWSRR